MRLSKIKLAGFKSFVDPTSLNLVSNLSAIVGPNGCGKSNIIDAIRWVMGESSAKKLRGGALADVIFNGSATRKPIGQASVELVFDNSDGTLGGEYAGFSEISIKRQVTRDGQSSYFLNGQRARRKDITDIFLGTGLGPRSYAIIEQGMISRVIEAKPEDMRNFIEEASGVSKYKERRRETENRIKHTNENLNRVNDLTLELEKQLNNLEKQAEAARKYQGLKKDEKTVEAELVSMSWQRLQAEIQTSEAAIRELTTEIEKHQAELTHFKAELEQSREVQTERSDHLNEVQKQYYSIGTEIVTFEQSLENLKSTLKALEENKIEEQNTLTQSTEGLAQDKQKIVEAQESLEQLNPLKEELELQIETYVQQFEESEESLELWRETQQNLQRDLHQATQSAEKEKTSIELLEKQVQQGDTRHQKLSEELKYLTIPDGESNIASMDSQLTNIKLQQHQSETQLSEQKLQKISIKEQIIDCKTQIKSQAKETQAVKDQLTALEAIQAVKLGKTENHDNSWATEKGLEQYKRFGEVIQVQAEWQKAIETLLANQFEAIYLEKQSLRSLLADCQGEQIAGLHLFAKDDSVISARPDSILSKVLNPDVLNKSLKLLLNQILVCEDMQIGLQQIENQSDDLSYITQSGIWLGHGWIKVPAVAGDNEHSILETEQRIQVLSDNVDKLEMAFAATEAQLEQAEDNLTNVEQLISDESDRFSMLKQEANQLESEIRIRRNKIEQAEKRERQITEELDDLGRQNASLYESIQSARESLQEHLEKMGNLHESMESHNQNKDIMEETRRQFKSQLQDAKEEQHKIALELQAKTSALEALNQSIIRFDMQIAHSQEKLQRIEQNILESEKPGPELENNLQMALSRRVDAEEMLNQARDDVHASDNELRSIEGQMLQAQNKIESVRDELGSAKMTWQASKVHFESVETKIAQIEIDPQAILQTLSEAGDETEWAQRLAQIGRQIQRLGAINLTAIDEFSAAEERKTYLDEQCHDLTEALATLEEAIQKIDQETRDRFQSTFDKINKGFKDLFPRLFGGGEAFIAMTDDDILNAGITVMARPPGKKNASIHQLSGGEKALTAVAFVFSIFLLNPAPFCLLDEVDAPLDDNNVGRFVRLVKEMSQSVQFIFISHNKIAIEMGEQLHGVTMREPGVSRLVSVDIDEAVDMATA
tara:strand:- start:35574 stop:39095 length:3522 start_codon:yes stop_codon:yes gene_type:complete